MKLPVGDSTAWRGLMYSGRSTRLSSLPSASNCVSCFRCQDVTRSRDDVTDSACGASAMDEKFGGHSSTSSSSVDNRRRHSPSNEPIAYSWPVTTQATISRSSPSPMYVCSAMQPRLLRVTALNPKTDVDNVVQQGHTVHGFTPPTNTVTQAHEIIISRLAAERTSSGHPQRMSAPRGRG